MIENEEIPATMLERIVAALERIADILDRQNGRPKLPPSAAPAAEPFEGMSAWDLLTELVDLMPRTVSTRTVNALENDGDRHQYIFKAPLRLVPAAELIYAIESRRLRHGRNIGTATVRELQAALGKWRARHPDL